MKNIKMEMKKMPTFDRIPVGPSHTNVVTFYHREEKCQLYFMQNGNLGITREKDRHYFLEINKDGLMDFIMELFQSNDKERVVIDFLEQNGIKGDFKITDINKAQGIVK
jgi:hypothetical protein